MDVLFKRGTQQALNALRTGNTTTAVEGAFYLTSDTNRLYIGKNIGTAASPVIQPVPVNEGVTVVQSVNDLPTVANTAGGEFYYIAGDNILCVSSGDGVGSKAWVQINPDTDTYVSDFDASTSASSGVVTVTHTITNTISEGGNTQAGDAPSTSVKFTGDNGIDVSLDSNDTSKLIIEGEKTTLSALSQTVDGENVAAIKLASDKHDSSAGDRDSTVILKPGNGMSMTTANGAITFSCTVPTIDGGTVAFTPGIASNSTVGFTVTVSDSEGDTASGTFDPTIQLGDHSNALIHFDNGKATLPVYTKDEVDARVKEFDAMSYKGTLGTTGSVQNIIPGGTASNGVVTAVDVGDTFKVSGDLTAVENILKDSNGKLYGAKTNASDTTHNGIILKDGDLLIAQGTEGSNGHITAASLKFDYVPSGNDYDSQYKGVTVDNGIEFEEVESGNGIGGLVIAIDSSNDYITATDNTTAGTERVTNTVTLKHKEYNAKNSSWTPQGDSTNVEGTNKYVQDAATGTNPITKIVIDVPQISYDKAGHITGITSKPYTVVDTFGSGTAINDLKIASVTTTGNNNTASGTYSTSAQVQIPMTLSNGDVTEVHMLINSSSLSLSKTATDDDLVIDLVWGTF